MATIALPHGAVKRAAVRLGTSRVHLSKVINGHQAASAELAVRILADEELRGRGLTLAGLLRVELPADLVVWGFETDADFERRRAALGQV